MIKLKSLLENDDNSSDEYYYHVTLAPYVSKIQREGLKVKGVKRTVTNYKEYSSGKIFLCDVGVVDWWVHKIGEHGFSNFDDERFHSVAVLKIPKLSLSNIEVDNVGSTDCRGGCYYTTDISIPPNLITLVNVIENPF